MLSNFDVFLRTAVSQKSVLQYAKSQKVSLANNILHREIDEVLALLSASVIVDSVHDWQQRVEFDRVGSTEASDSESSDEAAPNEIGGVVKLVERESEQVNRNFKQLDLGLDSSQALLQGLGDAQ